MPGFLLENDARGARKNVFDDWVDEQKRKAEDAARAAQFAVTSVATAAQPLSDEAVRRKQEFDVWVASQQAQQAAPQPAQPPLAQPAPTATPTEIGPPATPEAQQRANVFEQWLNHRQQDVAGVAQAVQGAIAPAQPAATPAPSLPHDEEPATATDHLSDRWKTQFDFGATYTGNYRTGTPHRGVDMVPSGGGGIGTEVDAFAPGKVTLIQRDSGAGGLMVYVQDDQGLTHAYMHLDHVQAGLAVGQQVARGQPIAAMGESGTEGSPHLHYEVRKNAASGDPLNQLIDPRPYVRGEGQPTARTTTAPRSDQPPLVTAIGKGQQAFTDTIAPLAKWFGDQTGIDPAVYLAIAANETGWGASQTAQQQNNLFSIQGSGANGSRWAGYSSPQAAFEAFNDLISSAPRYAKAWADRHNPLEFINDLRKAGYVVDEPGYPAQGWVDQVSSIWGNLRDTVGGAATSAQRTASDVTQGATTAFDNTIGQGAQAVASRAQDLVDRSGDLVRSSAQAAQDAQSRVDATLARINAENEAGDARQREARQRQLADVMQPRQYGFGDQTTSGFRAPDLSGVGDALGGAGRAIGGAFSDLGTTVSPWFQEDPGLQQRRDEARQALREDLQQDPLGLGTAAMLSSQQSRLEQRADSETGQALAEAVIRKAKDAGWVPESPEQEQALRTGLSTLTPMNVLMTVATGPEGLGARGLLEAGAFLGLSAVGAGAGEAVAPHLPEDVRPYAPLVGSFVAPVAGSIAAGVGRGALRSAPAQRFIRDESGELRIGRQAEEPSPNVARLAEQAASEEAAAEKIFSGPIAERLDSVAQQAVRPQEVEAARQTMAQLASRGDRITGVPQQFSTPEGLAQLRARLQALAEEGTSQKDWYSDSSHSILNATQQDKAEAENKVAMGNQDQRAIDLLYRGKPWEGRKTNNFYRNLMQHIDDSVYTQLGKETGQSGVTADIWMMRAFDYLAGPNQEGRRWLKAPSDQQYNFIQDEISRLGNQMGWTPEQVQAAVWSSTKAAAEGTGIVEAGFHYGSALERRMAQVSYTASPGSAEMQRVPGYMGAPEHERAAYNLASESGFLDPVTGRDQAAEAAGLLRGRTLDVPEVYGGYVGPGLQAEVPAPAARTSRTEPVFDPVTGERLRDAEGKLVSKSIPIREAAGLVFAPARDALNAFAAFRGKILKQDAVPWTRVFTNKSPLRDSNMNQLHIGRPLTTDEAQQLNQALIELLGGDGKHAVVSTADGAWVLNLQGEFMRNPNAPNRVIAGERPIIDPETGASLRDPNNPRRVLKERTTREENVVGTWLPRLDEEGKPLPFADNPSFNEAVEEAVSRVELGGDPDAHVSPFRSDGEYVFNDWEANPNGEGYQSQIESSGRADAFAAVEAAIARRVRQAQADAAARFGWPADPTNPFARSAEPGAVGERGLPGPTAVEPAAGVGPRAPPESAGFTAPGGAPTELPTTAGADIRGRLRDFLTGEGSEEGSIDPRTGLRIGGAALGGIGGAMTTSDQDDPFARYAKIAGGAGAGAFGPRFIYSAITHPRPTGAELEALRPRLGPTGPAIPANRAEQVVAYGKGNLLSGITTSLSNIIGQTIELARQPIVRGVSGYEDEAAAGVRAAADMLPTALKRFGNAWRTGQSVYATKSGSTAHPALRMLMATDDFFRTLGEGMGRGMEARRVLTESGNPTSAAQIRSTIQGNATRIVEGGNKASNLTVFGEGANTGLGKWISDQKQRLLGSTSKKDKTVGMLFDATVPFSSVPDRLWTAGVMRSPGVNEVAQFAKAGYHIAQGDERAARTALAEMAVGSVVNAAILTQVVNGNVTGPDDPEHPNSIRIGGTWVDYSGWGPYALPIAIPAAIMESVQKTGNVPDAGTMQYAAAMSKAVGKTLVNQSYLSSLLRTAGAVGRGDIPGAVGQLAGGYIDRYVPASGLLNQVEQSFDRNLREVDQSRPWEREASRIPGLSQFLPYKIAPTTGEPAVRPRGSPLGTLFRAETEETDPLKHALADLERNNYTLPEYKDYPDTVSWHGTEIKLRPEEQRAVTAALGKARADLAAEITSPTWDKNTDDEKAVFLKRQLARIDNLKTQAWLDKVDPNDAEQRLNAAEKVAGRLVQGRR